MASSGKRKTTMAKLSREAKLRERRVDKDAKKHRRKQARLDGHGPEFGVESEFGVEPEFGMEPVAVTEAGAAVEPGAAAEPAVEPESAPERGVEP